MFPVFPEMRGDTEVEVGEEAILNNMVAEVEGLRRTAAGVGDTEAEDTAVVVGTEVAVVGDLVALVWVRISSKSTSKTRNSPISKRTSTLNTRTSPIEANKKPKPGEPPSRLLSMDPIFPSPSIPLTKPLCPNMF